MTRYNQYCLDILNIFFVKPKEFLTIFDRRSESKSLVRDIPESIPP